MTILDVSVRGSVGQGQYLIAEHLWVLELHFFFQGVYTGRAWLFWKGFMGSRINGRVITRRW